MAKAKLQFLLDLEDRVSGGLQKIQTSLDNFKGKVEDMKPAFEKMEAVGTAGFAAITGVVALSLNAYGEAERSQRQLEHAIIGVSKGTREQVQAVAELSDALQKKTGIDGDALKMGTAQLSTFGLQSKSVVDLTKSLADLTVNQSGVNASADQYVQSANTIAKALQGQFGVLEKSGIRFTEAQKNIILYGKESEKVRAIQEGLAQNLRETTDTLSGVDAATARATRSFGEIFESIGAGFAPALASISDAVAPLLNNMADWIAENPKLTVTILAVSAGIFALIAAIGFIGLAIPPILAGFASLGTAATAVGAAFTFMLGPVGLIILAIGALVAAGIYLYQNWEQISAFAGEMWITLQTIITSVMQSISDTVTIVWEGIQAVFWTAINFIMGAWIMLLDTLVPGWNVALSKLLATAISIWTSIMTFFTTATTMIKDGFNIFLDTLSDKWSTVWEAMKEVFTTIWDSIKTVFDSVYEGISSKMKALVGPIQNIIEMAERALALAGGLVSGAARGAGSVISSILSAGSAITGRAVGGSVSSGTPYVIGERGPELFVPGASGAIVPNHALAGMGSGVTVVITGNTLLDRDSAQYIGNEMVKYLKDNRRV